MYSGAICANIDTEGGGLAINIRSITVNSVCIFPKPLQHSSFSHLLFRKECFHSERTIASFRSERNGKISCTVSVLSWQCSMLCFDNRIGMLYIPWFQGCGNQLCLLPALSCLLSNSGLIHEATTCNVEILHRTQMGQDAYIYGICMHVPDNSPFSPQVWGSLCSPQ